jgi:hypothetical protein
LLLAARLASVCLVTIAICLTFANMAVAYRKQINTADQTSAKNDLLVLSDLDPSVNWNGGSVQPDDSTLGCTGYRPRTSDLVTTGEAASALRSPGITISSQVGMFAKAKMVALDTHRTFIPALIPCLRTKLQQELGGKGRVLSLRRLSFPRLVKFVHASRVVYETSVNGKSEHLAFDSIFLGTGRTELTLTVVANLAVPNLPNEAATEAHLAALDRGASQILLRRAS